MPSEFIKKRKRIGEILIGMGVLHEARLDYALKKQQQNYSLIGEILLEEGFIKEDDLYKALAKQFGVDFLSTAGISINKDILKDIPVDLIKNHRFAPLKLEGNILTIVLYDPTDLIGIQNLEIATGYKVEYKISLKSVIEKVIKKITVNEKELLENIAIEDVLAEAQMEFINPGEIITGEVPNIEQLKQESGHKTIITLVNKIILNGVRINATDIHLEAGEALFKVRYRVDGMLTDEMSIDKRIMGAVVSRLKIISNLNIAEKRQPQDGSFKLRIQNQNIDFRIALLPSVLGENAVIRILNKLDSHQLGLEHLGIEKNIISRLGKAVSQPHGLVLTTGPTGSGKTTTLYSLLNQLNAEIFKIITVEDPVEYHLDNILQIQVLENSLDANKSITFAKGLKSILRHDPDVIMIGEIRDYETAEIAVQASLTGHMVLSTLHANSAIESIRRLENIGIDNYLIETSLSVAINQKLIRKICPFCKTKIENKVDYLKKLNLKVEFYGKYDYYKGTGCERCKKTGYKGRTGVFEILFISDEIKNLIVNRRPLQELKKQALKDGFLTIKDSCFKKVLTQETTLDEMVRVCV